MQDGNSQRDLVPSQRTGSGTFALMRSWHLVLDGPASVDKVQELVAPYSRVETICQTCRSARLTRIAHRTSSKASLPCKVCRCRFVRAVRSCSDDIPISAPILTFPIVWCKLRQAFMHSAERPDSSSTVLGPDQTGRLILASGCEVLPGTMGGS